MLGAASPKPGPLYLTALAAQKGNKELQGALSPPWGLPKPPGPPGSPLGSPPGTGQFQRIALPARLKNGIKTEQELGP